MCLRGTMGIVVAIAVAMLGVASGCGGGESSGEVGDPVIAESGNSNAAGNVVQGEEGKSPAPAQPKCRHVDVAKTKKAFYEAPQRTVRRGELLTAVVRTNCGRFSIALDAGRFPKTVNSFVFLASHHFYDGVPFDEAAEGTYLHGGDPPGKPTGPGYTVEEDVSPGTIYRYGMVVMAQPAGQPSTGRAGSQFFVVLAKPWIDMSTIYPPVGTVKDGIGILEAISRLGAPSPGAHNLGVTGPIGKLRRPVAIEGIAIRRG
jgi:peptidyl-prolyl cis-trans isomerase B (cyclophilin B)